MEHDHDVLVVGAGPGGSSCAYWLAQAGFDVVVVEKKRFPREKTCGDGLTPRAVRQLEDMGLGSLLTGAHRYEGLRAMAFGRTLELPWPAHPSFPSEGYTITRYDLDAAVAEAASKAGATLLQETEALEPLGLRPADWRDDATSAWRNDGFPDRREDGARGLASLEGALVRTKGSSDPQEIRARYVVVADGANSRLGRALGAARNQTYPMGMALRGYFRSDRHDDPFIESHLDIRDAKGDVVPGYGWIFPLGDGRVNVGVGVLSSSKRWRGTNTTKLMEAFVNWAPKSWGISEESSCGPPTGGRLPMGLSVGPRAGSNTLLVGDAAGSINPFNGEGISYGYETGRLAASCVARALNGEGAFALADYEARLEEGYGRYYRLGRLFVRLINHPQVLRTCVAAGMRTERGMDWLLRIMANLLRPDEAGPPEHAYQALSAIASLFPNA